MCWLELIHPARPIIGALIVAGILLPVVFLWCACIVAAQTDQHMELRP